MFLIILVIHQLKMSHQWSILSEQFTLTAAVQKRVSQHIGALRDIISNKDKEWCLTSYRHRHIVEQKCMCARA